MAAGLFRYFHVFPIYGDLSICWQLTNLDCSWLFKHVPKIQHNNPEHGDLWNKTSPRPIEYLWYLHIDHPLAIAASQVTLRATGSFCCHRRRRKWHCRCCRCRCGRCPRLVPALAASSSLLSSLGFRVEGAEAAVPNLETRQGKVWNLTQQVIYCNRYVKRNRIS